MQLALDVGLPCESRARLGLQQAISFRSVFVLSGVFLFSLFPSPSFALRVLIILLARLERTSASSSSFSSNSSLCYSIKKAVGAKNGESILGVLVRSSTKPLGGRSCHSTPCLDAIQTEMQPLSCQPKKLFFAAPGLKNLITSLPGQ